MSLLTPEGVRAIKVNEDVFQCHVLQVDVQRQKDGPFQRTAAYPHRDGVLEDCCFSLMCLLVMVGCNHEFVSLTFSRAALKTKLGKSDSKVSSLWSNLFDDTINKFEALSGRVNGELTSHCNRGGSNQVVVVTPGLSLAAAFRTGWGNHGRDTLWEHMTDSFVLSKQAGKAVAKWTVKIGDVIIGGQPVTLNDIGPCSGAPSPPKPPHAPMPPSVLNPFHRNAPASSSPPPASDDDVKEPS